MHSSTPYVGSSCTSCTRKTWKCDLVNDTGSNSDRGSPATTGDSAHRRVPLTPLRPGPGMELAPRITGAAPSNHTSDSRFPPESLCNELVDLYFDLIDEKQLVLFHRNTFIAAQRAGQVADFLVLGMVALMARCVD
ncbi:hypothetical protein BDW59DRAFT_164779 [Aspergillus cavernicola]|uniref:Transcription factor domain-containing protein n=1 Tax=Aspergillus cavernicola TaxID=176166 RepID=A0ABR4HXQ6_9EURO